MDSSSTSSSSKEKWKKRRSPSGLLDTPHSRMSWYRTSSEKLTSSSKELEISEKRHKETAIPSKRGYEPTSSSTLSPLSSNLPSSSRFEEPEIPREIQTRTRPGASDFFDISDVSDHIEKRRKIIRPAKLSKPNFASSSKNLKSNRDYEPTSSSSSSSSSNFPSFSGFKKPEIPRDIQTRKGPRDCCDIPDSSDHIDKRRKRIRPAQKSEPNPASSFKIPKMDSSSTSSSSKEKRKKRRSPSGLLDTPHSRMSWYKTSSEKRTSSSEELEIPQKQHKEATIPSRRGYEPTSSSTLSPLSSNLPSSSRFEESPEIPREIQTRKRPRASNFFDISDVSDHIEKRRKIFRSTQQIEDISFEEEEKLPQRRDQDRPDESIWVSPEVKFNRTIGIKSYSEVHRINYGTTNYEKDTASALFDVFLKKHLEDEAKKEGLLKLKPRVPSPEPNYLFQDLPKRSKIAEARKKEEEKKSFQNLPWVEKRYYDW